MQEQFDFTPGLTEQFRSFEAVFLATVRNAGVKQEVIATKCDLSPSEFSKSLNRVKKRRIDIRWYEPTIQETGDFRSICYLMEKYLRSPEARKARAMNLLEQLLPVVKDAMETLKSEP